MSFYTYPKTGGGNGGPATITYPLVGPAGSAGSPTFAITGTGGLFGVGNGGIGLSVAAGVTAFTSDAQGNLTLPHMAKVLGEALFPGGVNAADVLAQSLTVQTNANIAGGLGVGGDATFTGNLGVHDVNASGTLRGTAIASSGPLSGDSLNIANKGKFGSLEVLGTFTAGSLASTGPVYIPTAGPNAPGLALTDENNTGVYGAPGTLGLAVAGKVVASAATDLSFTLAGPLLGKSAQFTSLTASDAVSLGATEILKLTVDQNVKLLADLDVSGTARLASLQVAQLNTPGSASVGGTLSVGSTCQISGAATLQSDLSVAGSTYLNKLKAGGSIIAGLLVPSDGSHPPVYQDPDTHEIFSVILDASGSLALGNTLTVNGLAKLGAVSTGSASITGAASVGSTLSVGNGASITGGVTATGRLTGASLQSGNQLFLTGTGSPSGQVSAPPSSLYGDTSAGTVYVKMMGTDASGWVAFSTAASSLTYPLQAPATGPASPSYAFASSAQDGLYSSQAGTVGLSTAGIAALSFDAQQRGTLSAALTGTSLTLTGQLAVSGPTTLAGLTAGTTSVGSLTASSLTVSGNSTVNSLTAGPLTAQAASLASAAISGAATVGADLGVTGNVTAAQLRGTTLLLSSTARISTGTGDPNGVISGSPGDLFLQGDGGALWVKVSGASTTNNWSKVPTSAALTFPLQAPNSTPASPSYGFSQGGLGITSTGTQTLVAVTNGQVGWTLDATQNFSLAANLTVTGSASLQALTGSTASFSSTLSVGGNSSFQALTAASGSFTGPLSTTSTLQAASNATIGGTLAVTGSASVASLTSGGSTWLGATTAPTAAGQQGDARSITSGSQSFVVYTGSAWKQVAFVGDPSPSNFPLRGPPDSAAAPNFAPRATSPSSGLFSPGTDQLGLSTAGTQAIGIDSSQNVTLAAALSGNGAAFTSLTCSGPASIQGTATLGAALNLTGAATFSSTLSVGAITSSGTFTAPAANLSGALSCATLSTSGNASIGGNLTVSGTTTFTGVQKLGFVQTGDGLVTQPAVSFQSEAGLGIWRPGTSQWAVAAAGSNMLVLQPGFAQFAGGVRVGNTNGGLISTATNTVSLQANGVTAFTVGTTGITTFATQLVALAGTVAAPGLAVGQAGTGFTYQSDAFSNNVLVASVAGSPSAIFKSIAQTTPIYALGLGNPASATINGGILCSGQAPAGNVGAFPSQLFQDTRGGPGCLYLYEGTTNGTSAWAKILTTSSTITPTFPMQSTTLGSATSPAYGFAASGYTTTGIYAAPDAGSGNIPTLVAAANGQPVGYFEYGSANSIGIYTLALGSPAVSASPYNGCIRSSQQAALNNIIAAPGQLAINPSGGLGTVLAIKEASPGSATGWSFIYTQGSSQIGGAAGSTAAPYHSFSNSLSSGFSYQSSFGVVTSVAGTQVHNIGTTGAVYSTSWVSFPAGSAAQPSVCFNNNSTTGFYSGTGFTNPAVYVSLGGAYWGGFVRYGNGTGTTGWGIDIGPSGNFANGGIIVSPNLPTNTANSSPGLLFLSQQGSLWFKESGSQTQTGYAQVLTTSTQVPASKYIYQSAAPTAVASVGQVYSLTSDGNLYYRNGAGTTYNLSAPAFAPPASNTAPAATYTTVAGDANRTFLNNSATQSVITLYTVPSGTDYAVTFVVGGTGGFSITAPSGQIIYVGTTATTASNVVSAAAGSVITLSNPGGTGFWYATNLTGQWGVN